jgi:uncharacterized protein
MRLDELLRVSIFVAVVSSIYALAAALLIRALIRKLKGLRQPLTARQLWYRRTIFALALAGLACMAYGRFVEPYWPEVTEVEIKSPKLPTSPRPVRLVLISDIHSDATPRLEPRLPALIAAQKPDLILFAGDSANSQEGVPVFRRLMRELVSIAPTYAVRGNWDVREAWGEQLFPGTGIQELADEAKLLNIRGASLWLVGIPHSALGQIELNFAPIPPDAFTVFLCHTPDVIELLSPGRVDLFCAGHTHGGQVALPFYGALLTFSQFGKKYESGLYRVGKTWLYVTRGIGMEGGPVPRVRFCARPEITVIDLVGTG